MHARNSQTSRRLQQTSSRRSGLAVLEFAIISPMLLLLLLGVAECAQALFASEALGLAARQGAKLGADTGASAAEIEVFVKWAVAEELGVSQNDVQVDVTYAPLSLEWTQDELCQVTVSTDAGQIGMGFSSAFTDSRLQAHAAQRCQAR